MNSISRFVNENLMLLLALCFGCYVISALIAMIIEEGSSDTAFLAIAPITFLLLVVLNQEQRFRKLEKNARDVTAK